MKKELGLDFRLDNDHKIEYTRKKIEREILNSNLKIDEFISNWGEYWISSRLDKS